MRHHNYNPFVKAEKPKNIAVLFSGGLDSTFLIYKNLKEGHKVTPYYVEVLNNEAKSLVEKQQIAKLYHEFKKEFPDFQLNNPSTIVKTEIWMSYNHSIKFNQIPIWLFATNFMDHNHDEIQIAYVANDDATPYIEEMKTLYNNMGWLQREEYQRPELTFPLTKWAKFQMLDLLPVAYRNHITSCEQPLIGDEKYEYGENSFDVRNLLTEGQFVRNFEPCGHCDPCLKILNNKFLLDQYKYTQPVFTKLKIKNTIEILHELKNEARWLDQQTLKFFIDHEEKYLLNLVDLKSFLSPVDEQRERDGMQTKFKSPGISTRERDSFEILGIDTYAKADEPKSKFKTRLEDALEVASKKVEEKYAGKEMVVYPDIDQGVSS